MPTVDARADLHALLALAERRASVVAQALVGGEPEPLEAAVRGLHQCALELSGVMHGLKGSTVLDPAQRRRLANVGQAIAMQREACVRRLGVAERSLQSIVPATRASTYAGGPGSYGRGAVQCGAFKLLAA